MGFFDMDIPKPIEEKVVERTQFIVKDKFSYINGREQTYIVDESDIIYDIWDCRDIRNIYIWKSAKIGDMLQLTKIIDSKGYNYQRLENITNNPLLKLNVIYDVKEKL
jgi:hypothetical protein